MINFTKRCEYCGEEYWDTHVCEGTIAAAEYETMLKDALNEVAEALINNSHDPVNHPAHYTSHPSGVECIDITKHYNFQIGNAMKYLWRQGLKESVGLDPIDKQIQDCKKAVWYINSFINDLENKKNGA